MKFKIDWEYNQLKARVDALHERLLEVGVSTAELSDRLQNFADEVAILFDETKN